MPVVNVRLPLKVTVFVAVVLVIATVAAFTVLPNVVPPEFVIVKVPMSVPIAFVKETAAAELIVIFDFPNNVPVVPPVVPLIDFTKIKPGPPLPKVIVTLSASVILPSTTSMFGLL